jgi:hypothetical protein
MKNTRIFAGNNRILAEVPACKTAMAYVTISYRLYILKDPQSIDFILNGFIANFCPFCQGNYRTDCLFALSIRLIGIVDFISFEEKRCCAWLFSRVKYGFGEIPGLDIHL